jgi:hypothetical protein
MRGGNNGPRIFAERPNGNFKPSGMPRNGGQFGGEHRPFRPRNDFHNRTDVRGEEGGARPFFRNFGENKPFFNGNGKHFSEMMHGGPHRGGMMMRNGGGNNMMRGGRMMMRGGGNMMMMNRDIRERE